MWWKRVPDGWGCNMETPLTKLCSCRRDKHVMAFSRTKMCPARDASDWDADVAKVGRTVLTDTVKRRDCYLLYTSLDRTAALPTRYDHSTAYKEQMDKFITRQIAVGADLR